MTAQRGIEVHSARWGDLDRNWWTIPAEVCKNKTAHRVPLSIQATAIRFIDQMEEPCILVLSNHTNRGSGSKLRVKWSTQNTITHDGKPKFYIPRNKPTNWETAELAFEAEDEQGEVDDFNFGSLRLNAYTESRGFGTGSQRCVLSLIFPERS